MDTLKISIGNVHSNLYIGEKLEALKNYIPKEKVIIITDKNVAAHYQKKFPRFPVIVIGTGEKVKTIETINYIFDQFLAYEVDRSWFAVGIGGGVVCDVAGFASSIWMRGLSFGFVSTTLLSQVDASIGGKNGINFRGYKNMVGVFSQPEFVICDPVMLKTLERKVFIAGFAEIIKHALIKNRKLLDYLEENVEKALNYDEETLNRIILESLKIKSEVVMKDEKEKGERRLLNFGHTLGHAIENYWSCCHGEAISRGMVLAAKISEMLGYIGEETVNRIISVISNFNLPVDTELNYDDILDIIRKDKKREGHIIHFVVLEKIGEAVVKPIPLVEMEELINDLR